MLWGMEQVLDYSAAQIPASAIKSAGFVGAVRYISPAREKWMKGKPATRAEVEAFRNAGLGIAFVWQWGGAANPDAMRGYEGGRADAAAADKKLREIGCEGWPVFFAVDFDVTLAQWNTVAVQYFKACCEVLGRERVGIYGHSRVCDWAREDGVIGSAGGGKYLMWQTISWSRGAVHSGAVLLQNVHNVTGPGGVQVDRNKVLHSFWGQRAPAKGKKEVPTVTDNAVDIDLHHLIPFGKKTALPKKRIIIHTTENSPGTPSRNILDYQVRSRTGSYHRLVDASGQITLANTDDWQVWAVGNKGNDIALHVSCVARAAMTRAEWLAQPKMLEGVARVVAYWARTYDIPLVKLSRQELGAGKYGVAGHVEAQVWGNTTHWDPGPNFPYDVVLGRAKEINAAVKNPAPAPSPAPAPAPEPAPAPAPQPAPGQVVGVLDETLQSIINPEVHIPVRDVLRLADAYLWEAKHVLKAVAAKVGVDYDEVVAEAVKKDRGEK